MIQNPNQQQEEKSLQKYARNLVDEARAGKLDPVIGRDDEIRRVLQILSRRTKNNPILIGEPGTGKTAIVEGLAHRILRGDVPENLKNKQLYSLDMGALVAGAMYKGELEERLKPALARGEMRSIGATTLDEYQKYFEKDKALERRFQTVMVDEPDTLSSISILRGLKERYENHHKVRIQDDAVIAAVQLSQRYITERFLPDKAIDLMDEAAAKLRMERDSVPEELDEISRRLAQLEIEREAIRRESKQDPKLAGIEKEIADLRGQEKEMRQQWENEKHQADQVQTLKDSIGQLRREAEQAERDGDYAKVAEIRYSKLPELEKQLKDSSSVSNKLLRDEVTADDIADVVSRWTGIPVTKMQTSETEKLLHLEEELHKRVVGQEEAIAAVSNAVRRSRAGLQDPKRPIGSFIFLGSTGVGKTELAKALAEYLFDDETMMTRIDMSEYQEKFSVTRLIGAPPGYVGYDEGGQLTEAVRRKPYQVVLFDEIEKAHPDVFNTLLQVLDDGRLTDSKGRTVNFKNTIIIMTSNLLTGADLDKGEQDVRDMLVQRGIRPEFLNRIDEIIVFHPLNWGEVKQIVRLQVEGVQKMLKENGLTLEVSDEAIDLLANEGYDPDFGARPVKRAIQRLLLDDLSKELLAGRLDRNRPIKVDAKDGKLTME